MIKFVVKLTFLLALFFLLLGYTDVYFKSFKLFDKAMQDYDKMENIDVAIFGSSHAHSTYDPRIFESEINLQAYNFGAAAQRYELTKLVAEEIVAMTPPKLAIIDIYKNSLLGFSDSITTGLQFETLDNLSFSFEKLKLVLGMGKLEEFPFNYSTTIRNHNTWKEFTRVNFTRQYYVFQNTEFYNGFRTDNNCFNIKTWESFKKKYKGKNKAKYDFQLSAEEIAKIKNLINVFEKKKIPILFVNAPSYVNEYDAHTRHYAYNIRNYLKQQQIPFIDFNVIKDSLGLTMEYYKDPNHLNGKGAQKVSSYLAEYIKDHFDFEKDLNNIHNWDSNHFIAIKQNFKNALFLREFDESVSEKFEGIRKVALLKVSDDRYELVFETTKERINDLRMKINYKAAPNEQRNIPVPILTNAIDDNIRLFDYLTQCNVYAYHGGNYIIFPFQYNLNHFKEFQFFVGQDLKTELFNLTIDKIQ